MSSHIVYKIVNKINNKYYIGKHTMHGITDDGYMGSGTLIKKAIKKYGKENFTKHILFETACEIKAYQKEQEIVNDDILNDPQSYNLSTGGLGGVKKHKLSREKLSKAHLGKRLSTETKQKISDNHHNVSGKNNPMYGKTHSSETKSKMKKSAIGRSVAKNNPMYGKTHSDEVKLKLSLHGQAKWDQGSREKMKHTLSKGTYITPWGNYISISDALSHPKARIKDAGTLRKYCQQSLKPFKRGKYKNQIPAELGYSFLPR